MSDDVWWAAGGGAAGLITGILITQLMWRRALKRRRRARELIRGLDRPSQPSVEETRAPAAPRPAADDGDAGYEYHLDILLSGGLNLMRESMTTLINRYAEGGWSFYTISSDFKGAGGCWIVFRRRKSSG